MAGRGPAPKDPSARRRRNKPAPPTKVAADGGLHGPELPDVIDWPRVTLAWWDTWRRSPQASTFTETDWSFLVDTAVLHKQFWEGDSKAAAELRLRVAKYGATPEDRARLKLTVDSDHESPTTSDPRPRDAGRRERVLRAVSGD